MKYIKVFENFSVNSLSYDELMGKILHVYGSIPLFKQKAHTVIKKILYPDYYKLTDTEVNLTHNEPHDKARFVDYFDSLLTSKETRGHNFEGFLAGIYNGELSKPGQKFDVTIGGKTWSVKFVDNGSKAPEVGSFYNLLTANNLKSVVDAADGLTMIFKTNNEVVKNEIWTKVISKDITGGWLIAYPIENNSKIILNIMTLDVMKEFLMQGNTVAPKGGFKALHSLALSAKYKNFESNGLKTEKCVIIIPKLELSELRSIYINVDEQDWGDQVFGRISNRIRPDVLRYIMANTKEIGEKLLKFGNFKKKE